MTVQSGRIGGFKVCATESGTYYTPTGVTSVRPGNGWKAPTFMDTTQLGDTASRMVSSGFYDGSLTVTLLRDPADTNGQGVLLGNNPVWVQYSEDNSSFKKCQCCWTSDESHAPGANALAVTFTFTPAGGLAPAAV